MIQLDKNTSIALELSEDLLEESLVEKAADELAASDGSSFKKFILKSSWIGHKTKL
jgi:hypothetical protein